MKIKRKIIVVVGLSVLISVISACGGGEKISGKVSDMSGKPVEGANVSLTVGDNVEETKTDSDGRYRFSEPRASNKTDCKLTVKKDGFLANEQRFEPCEKIGDGRDITLMDFKILGGS